MFAGFLGLQGLVMMGLYLLGVVAALAVAWVGKWFIKIQEKSFFILELPVYRSPRWTNILLTMVQKAKIFVLEAGKVIMIISLILWALSTYGPRDQMNAVHQKYEQLAAQQPGNIKQLNKERGTELLQNSYAGKMGKAIEPVIAPLGFDWKIGIALITSFAAREVFVGTMATLYSVEEEDGKESLMLREKMQNATYANGSRVYTLAAGVSLMVFYVFAMQCMSTLAIVRRETRSWKWPVIQLIYMTGLAYVMSLLAYQLLK
jgi:ferrous iron transport protein B